MNGVVDVITVLLPVLYFGTVWVYAKAFFRNLPFAQRLRTPFLLVTVALHAFYIGARTVLFAHPPITNVFEIMTMIAFGVALSYAVIERITGIKNTGYFILILAFFFQLVSSALIRDLVEVKPILRSYLLGAHVGSALLGYSAFGITAVYSFLFLMLYHQIKSSKFGVVYENLPDLEKLERLAVIAVRWGLLFLTVTIGVGLIWLPRAFDTFSYFDPKLIGTVIVWLMYGAGLLAKQLAGWRGRRLMILLIVGFAISVFSMTIINVYLSDFHHFY